MPQAGPSGSALKARGEMTGRLAVLVTGATGQQGGAAARHLAENGHRVRALTRDVTAPKAQALAARGMELVPGDLNDRSAINKALAGMDAVFLITTPFEGGLDSETRQAIAVVDAAKAAGAFVVYTSVGSADRRTGIPHFESKFLVEQHLRASGVDATIIAPVYFMENLWFGLAQLRQGIYGSALTPSRKLAQVAVNDIGAVAASVLADRTRHTGKRYDLVGDELSPEEEAAILSEVTGRPIRYVNVPLDAIRQRMGDDIAKMNEWFEHVGYSIDRDALRRAFPDVPWLSFRTWSEGQDWKTKLAG
jgi:uncharacterized protein YbjT (DUF2867 family)